MLFRDLGLHWKEKPISLKFNLFFIESKRKSVSCIFWMNDMARYTTDLQSLPIFRKGALSIANLEVWNHSTSQSHDIRICLPSVMNSFQGKIDLLCRYHSHVVINQVGMVVSLKSIYLRNMSSSIQQPVFIALTNYFAK